MEEKKFFMWYDSGHDAPCYGPHYYYDEQLIGKKLYHSLEDMLKMSISEALKKRLNGAKIGTKIKMHYLHSNGNLMVKRIDEKEVKQLDELDKMNDEWTKIIKKQYLLEKEREKVIAKLFPEKEKY
jgi:hypothetical protein